MRKNKKEKTKKNIRWASHTVKFKDCTVTLSLKARNAIVDIVSKECGIDAYNYLTILGYGYKNYPPYVMATETLFSDIELQPLINSRSPEDFKKRYVGISVMVEIKKGVLKAGIKLPEEWNEIRAGAPRKKTQREIIADSNKLILKTLSAVSTNSDPDASKKLQEVSKLISQLWDERGKIRKDYWKIKIGDESDEDGKQHI